MPEPVAGPEVRPFTAGKLLTYSALGLLVGFGMCGLGMICGGGDQGPPDWVIGATGTLMVLSAGGFAFGVIWAIVEAIVNAFAKRTP